MPTVAEQYARKNIVTDVRRIYDAVAAIRNVYVSPDDRRPLIFDVLEHRSASRVPLCVPVTVHVATVDGGAAVILLEGFEAEALELAVRGLSFCHDGPLPQKLCTVTIELPASKSITFLLSVLWTTTEMRGGFRSGGRFLGLIEDTSLRDN